MGIFNKALFYRSKDISDLIVSWPGAMITFRPQTTRVSNKFSSSKGCPSHWSSTVCWTCRSNRNPIWPITVRYRFSRISLRKHAYSNILKISPPKNENFQIKNSDIFLTSAQSIDCGYSLEPLGGAVLTSTHNLCFSSRNKKNNIYPYKPQFYHIKVGFKGVKII